MTDRPAYASGCIVQPGAFSSGNFERLKNMVIYVLIREYMCSPGYEVLLITTDREEVLALVTKELAAVRGWTFREVDRWINSEYKWIMQVHSRRIS